MGTDSKRDDEKTLRVALILGAECGEDLRAQLSARGHYRTDFIGRRSGDNAF